MDNRTRFGLLLAFAARAGRPPRRRRRPRRRHARGQVAKGDSIFHSRATATPVTAPTPQGAVGPNLTDAEWIHSDGSYDAIVKQSPPASRRGGSKSGIPMPPKGGSQITDDEVKAVAAYVYSLSHKKS